MFPRVYIFLNGEFTPSPDLPKTPGPEDLVVCTDGGVTHAIDLGWKTDVLLGDFDSIPQDLLERFREDDSITLLTFPREKDKTDFELALDYALEYLEPQGTLEILGAFGRRWDMTFSNFFLPAAFTLPSFGLKKPKIIFREGHTLIYILGGPDTLTIPLTRSDSKVSLLPLTSVVQGVTLAGDFKYPLKDGTLRFGLTLGLSNELYERGGSISFQRGSLSIFIEPLKATY
ncbi:MAG: thiamine diphosphokinase [Deltaproteobacteria bacterium]|jgi:thiamine pyrophosphokinase|nr:thiamine diphosphokinase [Deltaproteobacteria bacterium]